MNAFEAEQEAESNAQTEAERKPKPALETPPIGSVVTGQDPLERAMITGELREVRIIGDELFGIVIDEKKVRHNIKINPTAETTKTESQPATSKTKEVIDNKLASEAPSNEISFESILHKQDEPLLVRRETASAISGDSEKPQGVDRPAAPERELPPPPPPPINLTPLSHPKTESEPLSTAEEEIAKKSPVEEINHRLASLKDEFDANIGSFPIEKWSEGKEQIISVLADDLGTSVDELKDPLRINQINLQRLTDSFFYSPSEFKDTYEQIKGEINSELNPPPKIEEAKEKSVSENHETPSLIGKAEEAIAATEELNAKTETEAPFLEKKTDGDLKEEATPVIIESTEKAPAEKMETARDAYLYIYEKNHLFEKRYNRGSLFTDQERNEWTQIKDDLKNKEEEYQASRREYLESTLKQFETEQVDKELIFFKHGADFPDLPPGTKFDAAEYKKSQLQEKAVLELTTEFKKLHDAKIEKAAQSYGPKFLERIREFGRNYSKQPLYRKLMLSAALMGGGMLAAAGGGGIGAALAATIGVGKIVQKAVSGTATFVGVEALIKRKQDKILAKKIEKIERNFKAEVDAAAKRFTEGKKAESIINFLKTQDEILESRFSENQAELKKAEKRMTYRRIFYASAAGVVIGAGLLAHGINKAINIFGSVTDLHSVETPSDHSGLHSVSVDTSHIAPSEAVQPANPDIPPIKPTPSIFNEHLDTKTTFSNVPNLESELSRPIATVKPGGSFWEAAKSLLYDGKISPEKFDEAWRHSFAEVNGVKTPLSELGLSHPGDHLTFIDEPGNPHFEISDHLKFGTDKDLFKYLKSAGKTIPQWLVDKFEK